MLSRGMVHEIVDVEVELPKLPDALDGFSIVQLSDLHIGMTIDRAFVQRVVDLTNQLEPDLIAMTGDLVDGQVNQLRESAFFATLVLLAPKLRLRHFFHKRLSPDHHLPLDFFPRRLEASCHPFNNKRSVLLLALGPEICQHFCTG